MFGVILSLFFSLLKSNASKDYAQRFSIFFLFSIFGSVVGFFTGASREAVVGTVLPILITTVVSYIGYLTAKTIPEDYRKMIPFCVLSLIISCWVSALLGMSFRMDWENVLE